MLGVTGLSAIAVMALFGPQLAPADPHAQRSVIFYPDSSFAIVPTPPDRYNLLGTDPLGRDQLSRLLWGARLTLTMVLLGLAGRALLALAAGLVAGWRMGTWSDHAIGRVTSAVGGVPQLMLALLLVIAFQAQGVGPIGFALALALVGWPDLAQFIRAEVIRIRASPHITAARAMGASPVHLVRVHVLRDLAPQLFGLLALEAGSVLLLLAELGFIGLFIAGGIAEVGFADTPRLPVRDRAPEWGQMLAGARQYAFEDQYVAFVPGVVVVSAVLAFNLFAEGLRTASDPFSPHRVSPRTLGFIGKSLAAAVVMGATGFGYVSATSSSITYEEGMRAARVAAARTLPAGELIGGVMAFSTSAHGMARPERLTYYFRDARSRLLSVSFVGGDENAIDVKMHLNADRLPVEDLRTLETATDIGWEAALESAESRGGSSFRAARLSWALQVVQVHLADAHRPAYLVRYGAIVGNPQVGFWVDAVNGAPLPDRPLHRTR